MGKRKSRARRRPSPPPAFNGDHGTGTAAAIQGTVLEAATEPNEPNPNNMGRRRRLSAIDALDLTMRQKQAAQAIEVAWCRLKKLESGGPLKAKVDASPKPDATVARQVDANSRWVHVMRPVVRSERAIVMWVCCQNLPITLLSRRHGVVRASARFKQQMDRVADHLGF